MKTFRIKSETPMTFSRLWTVFLFLVVLISNPLYAAVSDMACELEVDEMDDGAAAASFSAPRVAESLSFATYNNDPLLTDKWLSLFAVVPGTSIDDALVLVPPSVPVLWEAGTLELAGLMRIRIKQDIRDPGLKEIRIENVSKTVGATTFVSASGGVHLNVANGGWHEVEVEQMDNVSITFTEDTLGSYVITGLLKKLEIELDESSTTANPFIKEFELKLTGSSSIPELGKGSVTSLIIDVPETRILANEYTQYIEKIEDKPAFSGGHTEAEFEREPGALTEGVDITLLNDGNNDQLKERKGPCVVGEVELPDLCRDGSVPPCGDGGGGGGTF